MLSIHVPRIGFLRTLRTAAVAQPTGTIPTRPTVPGAVAAAAVSGSVAALVTAALSLVIAYAETRGLRVIENVGPLDGYGIAVVAVWAATWTGLFLRWRTRQLPWAPIRTLATIAVIIAAICLLFAFYRTAPLMS